uniref:Uncharacterized protein n=1 Tax=Vespula pensylvanica TaxID=30213 RepID=A0A834P2M8_VESPE|nr:hypothetical protein H0235_008191 [Vespula pensylvanica]
MSKKLIQDVVPGTSTEVDHLTSLVASRVSLVMYLRSRSQETSSTESVVALVKLYLANKACRVNTSEVSKNIETATAVKLERANGQKHWTMAPFRPFKEQFPEAHGVLRRYAETVNSISKSTSALLFGHLLS